MPPLLPIPTPADLLGLLAVYMTPPAPVPAPPMPPPPTLLLRYMTTGGPGRLLSSHTANVMSDVCRSLLEVAEGCRKENEVGEREGESMLGRWIDEEETQAVRGWWEGEWVWE